MVGARDVEEIQAAADLYAEELNASHGRSGTEHDDARLIAAAITLAGLRIAHAITDSSSK